jgi:hypothetical protein
LPSAQQRTCHIATHGHLRRVCTAHQLHCISSIGQLVVTNGDFIPSNIAQDATVACTEALHCPPLQQQTGGEATS